MEELKEFYCPQCKSIDCKAAKVIYWQGYQIEDKATSRDTTEVSVKSYISTSTTHERQRTVTRSLLTQLCSPPIKPSWVKLMNSFPDIITILLLVGIFPWLQHTFGWTGLNSIVAFVALGFFSWCGVVHIYSSLFGNLLVSEETKHMREIKKWENTWICLKCGHHWFK